MEAMATPKSAKSTDCSATMTRHCTDPECVLRGDKAVVAMSEVDSLVDRFALDSLGRDSQRSKN